jgi:hypothetical protein
LGQGPELKEEGEDCGETVLKGVCTGSLAIWKASYRQVGRGVEGSVGGSAGGRNRVRKVDGARRKGGLRQR